MVRIGRQWIHGTLPLMTSRDGFVALATHMPTKSQFDAAGYLRKRYEG